MGVNHLDILDKTLIKAEKINDGLLQFTTTNGEVYQMLHFQECCEDVYIEAIDGDLDDLVGSEILMAEKVTESGAIVTEDSSWSDAALWTFYKFATNKGYVTIRWVGTSNGYYSMAVDFVKKGTTWSDMF